MSDLNLEVWKPKPIIPIPGTYVSRFNRYYLSINPNPAEGPQTWRISDPDEYPCDGGAVIPPGIEFLVVAQAPVVVTGDGTGIEYSFSLDGVPAMDSGGDSLVTFVDNLEEPILLTNIANDPMRSLYDNNDKATVTTFHIYGLTYEEFSVPTGRSMRSTVYNSNSSIPVSSSDPIQTASNVASTDLFFNISSLSHAT
jgi:hypothetical protein